jgi:hypothetical protein
MLLNARGLLFEGIPLRLAVRFGGLVDAMLTIT